MLVYQSVLVAVRGNHFITIMLISGYLKKVNVNVCADVLLLDKQDYWSAVINCDQQHNMLKFKAWYRMIAGTELV